MNGGLSDRTGDPLAAEERSFPDDLRDLVGEAREYAGSEVAYQKERARYVAGRLPAIAIYGVLAFLFVFFALGGLVVGLIIALAPWLTAWGSMAAVCLALGTGALICLLLARRSWRAITATFAEGTDL